MSILANLSRRFHLLTTDAKPDPPRVIINDSLNSNDTSSSFNAAENVSSNTMDNSTVDVDRMEEKISPNDESMTNSNSTSGNTGKKPNIRTKKKSQSGHTKNIINYNIVNSNGVKIGETITYVCNINQYDKNNKDNTDDNNYTTMTSKPMTESIKILTMCKNELTINDMFLIKNHIDNNWRDIFKSLGYSKGQLDQFEETYKSKGIDEMIYQILLDWKRENGKEANIGIIVKILWQYHQYDCVERLITANDESIHL